MRSMSETRSTYVRAYAAQYERGSFETVLVEARRRRVLASMAGYPHTRILEVGCGLEPIFSFVPEAHAYAVVEPAADFAEVARRMAEGRPTVRVLEARMEDVINEVADFRPDFVILSSLLHEVPDADGLLHAVRKVCTVETTIHVNVPNVRSFHRLLALEMGLISDVFEQSEMERRFGRHRRFDHATLLELLNAARLEVLDSGTYFVKPFTNEQMDVLVPKLDRERLLDGLDRIVAHMPNLGAEIFADVRLRWD